ncbi:lipopolysaccharide-induced tumor necrosis factor-alpha factor homolog [Rhopilema esculentum]|uniref:lipopolysaccharide-induced tumor necrosis factor-alpha factor homolog n=1 Tax=Rhopilema esculentum TaxID=499914 RepID=UPI0031CE1F20|eukprot:gene13437-4308_t
MAMTEKQAIAQGYQDPPPQYTAPPGTAATTTTVMVTAVQQQQVNTPFPANITCTNCKANVITEVSYKNGTMTYLMAGGMCLAGLWLGCCFIPFCCNRFKDIIHTCPNCKAIVGFHKRI